MEVFRKISIKNNKTVTFDVFLDLLKEVFFVKYIEETIIAKQTEIKILDESNLMWSMDKKGDAIKYIEELQLRPRNTSNKAEDREYLITACKYLEADDLAAIQRKMKSVRIPFGSLERG